MDTMDETSPAKSQETKENLKTKRAGRGQLLMLLYTFEHHSRNMHRYCAAAGMPVNRKTARSFWRIWRCPAGSFGNRNNNACHSINNHNFLGVDLVAARVMFPFRRWVTDFNVAEKSKVPRMELS